MLSKQYIQCSPNTHSFIFLTQYHHIFATGKGIGRVYKLIQHNRLYPETNTIYLFPQTCIDEKNILSNEDIGESNKYLTHTKKFSSTDNNNKLYMALEIYN